VRVALAAALVVSVTSVTRIAPAQSLPGGATISFGALDLPAGATTPATQYFNFAHCACGQPGAAGASYIERSFAYQLLLTPGTMAVHRPLQIWVGAGCDVAATRASSCHQIASATIADLSTIPASGVTPVVPVYDLMEPEHGDIYCQFRAQTSGEWAMADGNGDGTLDYFVGKPIAFDAKAPPLPTDFAAQAGPASIDLTWTPPPDVSDVALYQALCATADESGSPASTQPPAAAAYVTARNLCGESQDVPLVPSAIMFDTGSADANTDVALPQGIAQLDPSLVCATVTDPTATSMHIGDLVSNEPLVVLFLAIDAAGNPAATYFYPTISADSDSPPAVPHHNQAGCACRASDPRASVWPLAVVVLGLSRRRRSGTRHLG
jgi:MYXO-CTERM domain-containing protein